MMRASEIADLLGVSKQGLYSKKWLPPPVTGKGKVRWYDREKVMDAIAELQGTAKKAEYIIQYSRFREESKKLIINTMSGKRVSYDDYKIVPNKGDLMLALRLKEDTSRPWIYERRRDVVKCDWMIK